LWISVVRFKPSLAAAPLGRRSPNRLLEAYTESACVQSPSE
jgi:hypothetical protein